MDEVKAVWSTKFVNDLPDSSFLFIESGGEKDGEGKTKPRSLRHFPVKDASGKVDLPHLRNAIARIPQSNAPGLSAEKKKALQNRARRMLTNAQKEKENSLIAKLALVVKSWFGADEPYDDVGLVPGLALWKESDDAPMRWLGVFSNNYRDDDVPAEILSADAHRDFAKAVDEGLWPPPKLWFWHVPGTEFGEAEWVTFDEDTGFQLAMGTIYPGKELIAQYCQKEGYVMSHGMPPDEVQRAEDDPTVITRYRSREVSALPAEAAANKITSFLAHGKGMEDSMNIPENKVEALQAAGYDVEKLSALLQAGQQQAEDEQRESKEVEAKDAEPVEVQEAVEEVVDAEAAITDPEPVVQITAEDVATAAGAAISAALEPIAESLTALNGRLETMEGVVKEISVKQAEQAAELELTPAASLAQMIKSSVIGNDATRVDGRSTEARDTPKEAPTIQSKTGIASIDAMLAGRDWRETVPGN